MPPKGQKKGTSNLQKENKKVISEDASDKASADHEIDASTTNSSNGENLLDKNEKVESESVKGKSKTKGKIKLEEEEKNEENSDHEDEVEKRPTRGSKRRQNSDDKQLSSKQAKLGSKSLTFACEKTTPDGKNANLKISCWNIAGLRAWIKKEGSLDYILHQEQPDMMILLETKCPDNKLPPEIKIPDYQMYTVASEKDGYCGVLLYSKTKPMSIQYGIGDKEFDHEGRCIIAEYKEFYLICTYVPNAGQGLKTLQKKLKWNIQFLKLLKEFNEKKPVILCGDLNVAHEAIDLANPKSNTKSAGFTKEEREDFTKLLNEGFVDTFRHMYPDQTGAYTFWSNRGGARSRNVGWRLDYFVVSERFLPNICDSLIRSQILGSDHCPVTLCLNSTI